MKKCIAVLGLFLMPVLFVSTARADGNFTPALVVSTVTNQGYLYPATGAANNLPGGGVLVNNGGGVFNWSNQTTATTATGPALQSVTLVQSQALVPATTGQLLFCSNCAQSVVCASTGILAGAWVQISSAPFSATIQACK